jgi:peptide/nickel transport system permease protein
MGNVTKNTAAAPQKSAKRKFKKQSKTMEIWRRLLKNKSSVAGLAFLVVLAFVAIFANVLIDPELVEYQDYAIRNQPPSAEHWFGTDVYGRDILARVVYGARVSLAIGVVTIIISTVIGALLGAIAAYYGGLIDEAIMRVCDVLIAVPETLMSMCVVTVMGANATSLITALVIAVVPGRCRLVRASVLGVTGREYVEAARAAGMKSFRLILTQILPNSLGPVIVVSFQGVSNMILTAAGLSYLGVGIQPPTPEWGAIIAQAKDYLRIAPYMCVIPGIVLALTALSFNLLGDGLRDALDPKLKD